MLVWSPSTASAHKLQSRVSIDLTGDDVAAPADVCNSIVFLCLEASDAGRLLPVADAATLRCLQWLASGLPPVDRGVTVDAVRQNLRDGCGVTATEAQVAGWLSR